MVSYPSVHRALIQLGYKLVNEDDDLLHYQLKERPDVNLFLSFHEFMKLTDLRDVLKSHSIEIVEPFFAMYEAL